MNHLKDITVLVLGLGESGLAMARWCERCGASVRVWDSREAPPHEVGLAKHAPGAVLLDGPLTDAAFDGVQLVLKSPGLSPTDTRIAEPPAFQRAARRRPRRCASELGYGAHGNEVNRSLKSVWFAAPPSMGLTLKISSTVRSVEPWS